MICENNTKTPKKVEEILAHELVHLYDYCTKKIDFSNMDHLACTEIRAASLISCSDFNFRFWSHADCVKSKAKDSIRFIKQTDSKESYEAVLKVFDKCYNDLEPLGTKSKCSARFYTPITK